MTTDSDGVGVVAWLCTYGAGEPCLTVYTNEADAAYCQQGWGGTVEPLILQSDHRRALADAEGEALYWREQHRVARLSLDVADAHAAKLKTLLSAMKGGE